MAPTVSCKVEPCAFGMGQHDFQEAMPLASSFCIETIGTSPWLHFFAWGMSLNQKQYVAEYGVKSPWWTRQKHYGQKGRWILRIHCIPKMRISSLCAGRGPKESSRHPVASWFAGNGTIPRVPWLPAVRCSAGSALVKGGLGAWIKAAE